MDCHRPSAFAMTAHTNSSLRELLATRGNLSMGYNQSFMEFFFFFVFVFIVSGLWIAFLLAMTVPHYHHCENRRFVAILFILGSSLRGFEKAVAISFILGLSLREPKVCGNLSIAPPHLTNHRHCESSQNSWQSRYGNYHTCYITILLIIIICFHYYTHQHITISNQQ